ncbi:MAG TPA: nuclear transport factor 2 family protein [Acidobacteriaceae bacterium]|jgi:ketosteroid isomerase-like protein|nr:nuclear transport factor 2 family protein [Acidobacteriaceae bacterium]
MAGLTEDAIRTIEEIHAKWIAAEIAGDLQSCLDLCAEEIELWPPDQPPAIGRAAVARKFTAEAVKVNAIDIANRRIRGSKNLAYLTANFNSTFTLTNGTTPRQVRGSHLWILQNSAGAWLVTLVSWSIWIESPT